MEGPSGPYSYIDYGPPGKYNDTWSLLFRKMSFLDACWQKKIFLSLIGDVGESNYPVSDIRRMALIATNDGPYRFSRRSWRIFLDTLQPHTYQPGELVICFADGRIELNIYAFLYAGIHPNMVLADPGHIVQDYYKSGTILIYDTSMNTYRESVPEATGYLDPGPIERLENNRGYVIEFMIAGQRRRLVLVPSIIDTWPE